MADKIVVTVVEAMSLEPTSPVFVIIGAAIHYTLVIRGNKLQVVTLPSPFYQWTSSNSSIAQVDTMLGKAHALTVGVTTIIVEDTRVAGHIQMSSLHVVLPDTLSIYISPLSLSGDPVDGTKAIPSGLQWYLISGRQYLIQVKVFSQGPEAHEIYLTEKDDVKLHDNQSEYWNILPVPDSIEIKHGWWNSKILIATFRGHGRLMATLTFSKGHQQGKAVLKVMQDVIVCDQVKFSTDRGFNASQSILLPWAPDIYQEVELKASGGCAEAPSDFKWFSSDMTIVSVSASGIVQARKPGKANIRVMSMFDSFNYDEVVVEVSIPSSLVMLPNFPVETVVGSHIQASATLKTSSGVYFYRCDAFSPFIRWKTGSDSFAIVNVTGDSFFLDKREISELYNMSSFGPPCSWTRVYAYSSGRTMLHATLAKEYQHFDHFFGGSILLKASSHIAAYLPLIVHQAGDGNQFGGYWFDLAQSQAHNQLENLDYLYLVPGTHLDVMLHGGPERWDEGVQFVESVETFGEGHIDQNDGVLVYQLSGSDGNSYRILCEKLGTFKLHFKRGNLVGNDHLLPVVAEVTLSVTCSYPSSIVLLIDEAVNEPEVIQAATQADHSPGRIRVTPVTVANGRTIRISAVGITDSGLAFGNCSSLSVRWEINNCDELAFWEDISLLTTVKSSWENFLILQNASGLCLVRATVIGFTDITQCHSISPFDSSDNVLTDAAHILLVSNLRVYPEFRLLFLSPEAKSNLSIVGGSCLLDAVVNDTQIVEIVQAPTDFQCSQLVLAPKGLGTAIVTVYDVGLSPPLATSSVVQVADVEWIKINSLEEISVMEGTFLSLNISAGINDGKIFDSSQYVYMKISVHIENHIVDLVSSSHYPFHVDGYLEAPFLVVWARYLGVTTLYVSARQQSGREILSEPIKVEVYEPPMINPSDIFLVPGASYVLTVTGGPRIGAYVEYAGMDDDTATIDKLSGHLSAISPGNTTLIARVYGNGDTMICQAFGSVKVGVPSSANLNSQSERIAIGREMPIFPSFLEGNLFSFYELCKNYKWTIENEEVLSFRVAEQLHGKDGDILFDTSKEVSSTGYLDEKNVGFIQVLYGKSAGRTDVSVSLDCDFTSTAYSHSRSYNASLSLWVESDLPLSLGVPITWVLPPHYTTSNVLPTSSDLYDQRDAHGRKGKIIYSLLKECSGKSEELQSDAIYIDGKKIKTTESGSIACIIAKDKLTRRAEVAVCVRVAVAAQIRITKYIPIRSINLAVGAELNLPVNFYDISGHPFQEAYNITTINVETNYRDVVFFNDTLDDIGRIHLKAMRPGRALVRVSFDSHIQKFDHLMISVGARLYPVNPVLDVGSHLNFSIEGLDDQLSGHWLSTNQSVIMINAFSGKAEAIGEGTSWVIFEGSKLKLQTLVTVLGGIMVFIDAPMETLTNVAFPAKGYGFPVKLSNAYQKYESSGNSMFVTYNCKVDPSFIGYTKPWLDVNTGNLYCLFFPFSPEHLVHSIPNSNDKKQGVSVSVKASLQGADDVSGSASALFIGGFSIRDMDANSLHLNLTSDSNKSVITILGNTNVEVYWQNKNHLSVIPVHREDSNIGGCLKYEVKAIGTGRFKDKVIITLPALGQRAELDVSFVPGEDKAMATTSGTSLWAAVGCFTLLLVIVAIFICFLDKPDRSRPSASPATTSATTLATPPRSSPADVKEQSPRTPQPFLDYVKRTIDETPYYRQEVRRRFNPQNTF